MMELEMFKMNVQRVISNSGLNAGEVYYVMKDLFNEIETTYYDGVNAEIKKQQEAQKKAQEEAQKKAKEVPADKEAEASEDKDN